MRLSHRDMKGLLLTGLFLAGAVSVAVVLTQIYSHAGQAPGVRPVKSSEVCMVNDQVMGREQIPVKVDGKTYYGCCENCKARLRKDAAARFAKDPLTGNKVDKALAFIVEGPGGEAMYFESSETAGRYPGSGKSGQ